ncbi:MAG TPA: type II secretion system F family protein [Fimbriimonadaceae bacterium]|nr:type II secretion system F family protein [Fimbriimonadaceae bacterium]
MPIFQYSGTNAQGQTERGMMPGSNADAVTQQLQSRGLKVTEVRMAESQGDPLASGTRTDYTASSFVAPTIVQQVSLAQLQFFFRQLGAMLNAGVGYAQALETLSNQSQSGKFRQILRDGKDMVARGEPLSRAFERHPDVFSPLMLSMVRAGEEGGFLTEQCKRLSEYIEREINLRNMIRAATIYPKVTVVASIIIVLGANWIIDMLGKEGAAKLTTPLTSGATWFVLVPVIVLAFIYVKIVLPQPRAKYQWDAMMVRLPGLGKVIHGFAMAKFGRSFGALYGSGVPIPKALLLSADACGNQYVRSQVYPCANLLESGGGITEAFAKSGAFSPMVLDMTKTGEMTGNVDEMLHKLAEYYEEEGTVRAKQFAVIFGVVVLVMVGAYVGYIYITNMLKFIGGAANAANQM